MFYRSQLCKTVLCVFKSELVGYQSPKGSPYERNFTSLEVQARGSVRRLKFSGGTQFAPGEKKVKH